MKKRVKTQHFKLSEAFFYLKLNKTVKIQEKIRYINIQSSIKRHLDYKNLNSQALLG